MTAELIEPDDTKTKSVNFIQVTNLSIKASDKQIEDLFSQIGNVTHIEVFPKDKHRSKYGVLVAFIEYQSSESVYIAQHLTSTVFIDKPIVVIPAACIPSEYEALQLASALATTKQENDGTSFVKQLVPTLATTIPSNVANPTLGTRPLSNVLVTGLGQLKEAMNTSPNKPSNVQYITATGVPIPDAPKLVEDYSIPKEKEAKRTVFVDNLNPHLTLEHILNYFQFCGEIRYLRVGGEDLPSKRFAFIEFIDLAAVNVALQYDGSVFCDRTIRVIHSRHWLQKPPTKRTDAERENDILMKRLMDAQALIDNAINKDDKAESPKSKEKKRSRRSRSRDKSRRSRSRDRSRKSRSRDRSRRSRSRDRSRKSRSRDRSRKKKSRRRSRSRRSRS